MSTALDETLADFLLRHHPGPAWRSYRQRCLDFWRETYGESIAAAVEKRVRAKYNKEPKKK